MGVHDTDKYAEVKKLLEIPEDEPIFIIRAQDKLSEDAILDYASLYLKNVTPNGRRNELTEAQRKFLNEVELCADHVWEWQSGHEEKVKVPD